MCYTWASGSSRIENTNKTHRVKLSSCTQGYDSNPTHHSGCETCCTHVTLNMWTSLISAKWFSMRAAESVPVLQVIRYHWISLPCPHSPLQASLTETGSCWGESLVMRWPFWPHRQPTVKASEHVFNSHRYLMLFIMARFLNISFRPRSAKCVYS